MLGENGGNGSTRTPSAGENPSPSESGEDQALPEHPTRAAVIELLSRKPGLTFHQIRRALDLSVGELEHHLRRLVQAEQLVRFDHERGRDTAYFLGEEAHLWDNPRTRLLYGRSPLREVALYVAHNPGCTSDEIAKGTERSRSITQAHIRTLKGLPLVEPERDGRQVHYHPTAELERWANTIGTRFPEDAPSDDASGPDGSR